MKVIILVGGRGTRLTAGEAAHPKALFEIGGRPIIWHIMKLYSHAGFHDFVLTLGYRAQDIVDYFVHRLPLDFLPRQQGGGVPGSFGQVPHQLSPGDIATSLNMHQGEKTLQTGVEDSFSPDIAVVNPGPDPREDGDRRIPEEPRVTGHHLLVGDEGLPGPRS